MDIRSATELLAEIKQITKEGEIALSKRLGTSQPTVNRILRGNGNCKTDLYLAIMRLHAEVTAQAAA